MDFVPRDRSGPTTRRTRGKGSRVTRRIGVDTGGTFTDVVLFDESEGEVHVTKTPSTPPEFDEGVLNGVDKILNRTGIDPRTVSFFSHGTTVGTNAILEGETPRMGLITNEGLRDIVEIGDQTRPDLYDLQTDKPPTLIRRALRRGVPGRLDADGNEIEPIDREATDQVIDELIGNDVESIVVSLLFSYQNDDHEREVGRRIDQWGEGVEYALASEVHPESREYDRTITTVLNEAIKTKTQAYLARLEAGIDRRGIDAPVNIMHSGGGVFGTSQATARAIRTVLSGPSAGAVAAKHVCEREGFEHGIGMDVGGTSADVSLVRDGELARTVDGEINDLPLKMPMIDINTVGAGGGSVAWLDEGGAIRVGPESAGADPGPVCYGRGGSRPTVTDANLLLGRIDASNFLDGGMSLDTDRAREVFEESIAAPLERSVPAAADGVLDVANAKLARELRRVTVERGNDPGEFALVAFGGAGPLQAPAVAAEMDVDTVIVPRSPGVLSAKGLLIADVRVDESHAYAHEDIDPDTLDEGFEALERELLDRLDSQGFPESEVVIERAVDARYHGQSYEITVPFPSGAVDSTAVTECREVFHAEHARLYGHAMPDEHVEIVTLRANGLVATTDPIRTDPKSRSEPSPDEREVYFDDAGFVSTDVYDRTTVGPEDTFEGPAIFEEKGCTTLVPSGTAARISDHGAILIDL